ncbi:MAG: ATP-binding cassette domain-containing protein [Campylobacter sp.]|nr:ATP-binding cassette domain-containing protein [Campylobacter sp.]
MIKLTKITKKFGAHLALNDINLNIHKGDRVLLAGQNGAGKSTLLKVMLGELYPDAGEILVNSYSPFKNRKKALSSLAFVPQSAPPLKLNLAEISKYANATSNAKFSDIENFCNLLNLDISKELLKPFYKLSGGMKQKFLISLALARNSEILLFDEPTANLDTEARSKFLDLIKTKFLDKTILVISHRLSEIEGIANRVVELDLGEIVKDQTL